VSVAFFVMPPREAAIVTTVFLETDVVVTLNVADLAPEGMINFDGTLACNDWLLVSVITTPAAGAGPVSVTFPTAVEPPETVDGSRVSDVSAAGWTVTFTVFVTPEKLAVILPIVVAPTGAVETEKLTDVAFAGTVTTGGTEAAEVALERLTLAPIAGAGPVRLTVPVIDCPPVILDGLTLTEFSVVGLADCVL
jgi:hypothetical protein